MGGIVSSTKIFQVKTNTGTYLEGLKLIFCKLNFETQTKKTYKLNLLDSRPNVDPLINLKFKLILHNIFFFFAGM